MFAVTTTWVMEEKQPAIHSSIWYGNDIGHPSHSKTSNSRNTQVEQAYTTKSQMHKHVEQTVVDTGGKQVEQIV